MDPFVTVRGRDAFDLFTLPLTVTTSFRQPHRWHEPQLGVPTIAVDVHVRRLTSVGCAKEELIAAHAEEDRHPLHERRALDDRSAHELMSGRLRCE